MLRFLNSKTVVILLALFCLSANSFADPMYYTQYSGYSGANTYPFSSTEGQKVEWLFQPGDFSQPTPITGFNQINAIYFFMVNGSSQSYTDLTIKMAQADITTLPNQFYSGTFETVYTNSSATLTQFSPPISESICTSVQSSCFRGYTAPIAPALSISSV